MSDVTFNSLKEFGIANTHEETPRQEVSDRSILRVQQLSNELRESLNKMDLFSDEKLGDVAQVLFAARDYRQEEKARSDGGGGKVRSKRWYNFRLCANYGFASFQKSKNSNALEYHEEESWYQTLKSHTNGIEELFGKARFFDPHTSARFDVFAKALEAEGHLVDQIAQSCPIGRETAKNFIGLNRRTALDQLLIALAVIPYRGVLLSLLEKAFGFEEHAGGCKHMANNCVYFESVTSPAANAEPLFHLQSFDHFTLESKVWKEAMPSIDLCGFSDPVAANQAGLFGEFLLPFTRGAKHSQKRTENTDMKGFAIPAYDIWSEGQWKGGMLGWLVVFLSKSIQQSLETPSEIKMRNSSWLHFTDLARSYVRRIREANLRDLLEDYALPSGSAESPREYFNSHIHQLIGWRDAESGETELKVPLEKSNDEIVRRVNKLNDTIWNGEPRPFPPGTRRLCRLFVDELTLVKSQRQLGQQSGFLASAHDYSKDIGSVLLKLRDFKEKLDRSKERILEKAKQLSLLDDLPAALGEDIARETAQWEVTRLDWFAGVRFTNAHLETQTRGVLIPEPIECLSLLEGGTLHEINELVRILVWQPVPFQELKDRERQFRTWAPEKLRQASTWCALFKFDAGANSETCEFHERLGERVMRLILDEEITQPAFARRFPMPLINPDCNPADNRSILWADNDAKRWKPLDGLLPLFVFSMRFAYQCTWAKTLIEEPSEALPITILTQGLQPGRFELMIRFPSPLSEPVTKLDLLPYHAEWRRQIGHYTNRQTNPWKAQTAIVTQDDQSGDCTICLQASR